LPENEAETFRSGFIALVGRPNVGKSTLLNRILGEKVAIVSDKPQTTRTRILGVKHLPGLQMIFLDTPGIHQPLHRLNRRMVEATTGSLHESDLACVLVEATERPNRPDRFVFENLKDHEKPLFLVINKVDRVDRRRLLPLIQFYAGFRPFAEVVPVSAQTGENVDRLVETLGKYLPEGPPYFSDDVVTDQTMRFMAAEVVREKALHHTHEEVPHAVAVGVEEFMEEPGLYRIQAVIYVDRDSQKGILIGKAGERLKVIGTEARVELERLWGVKVFLRTWVKVKKDWRQDDKLLEEIYYPI
jgi:GTP-binding protein Era